MSKANEELQILRKELTDLECLFNQLLVRLSELYPDKVFVIHRDSNETYPRLKMEDAKPARYRHKVALVMESDDPKPPWQFDYSTLYGFETADRVTERIQ